MNSVWQKSQDFPKIDVHEFHLWIMFNCTSTILQISFLHCAAVCYTLVQLIKSSLSCIRLRNVHVYCALLLLNSGPALLSSYSSTPAAMR
jgi:hypothetical protein